MKFILNMNMSTLVGKALSELGQEWSHARQLALQTATDAEIVDAARRAGAAIVTHDLDYADLLMLSDEPRPSVLLFRFRASSPQVMSKRLKEVWTKIEGGLSQGAMVVLEDAAVRVRPWKRD